MTTPIPINGPSLAALGSQRAIVVLKANAMAYRSAHAGETFVDYDTGAKAATDAITLLKGNTITDPVTGNPLSATMTVADVFSILKTVVQNQSPSTNLLERGFLETLATAAAGM